MAMFECPGCKSIVDDSINKMLGGTNWNIVRIITIIMNPF